MNAPIFTVRHSNLRVVELSLVVFVVVFGLQNPRTAQGEVSTNYYPHGIVLANTEQETTPEPVATIPVASLNPIEKTLEAAIASGSVFYSSPNLRLVLDNSWKHDIPNPEYWPQGLEIINKQKFDLFFSYGWYEIAKIYNPNLAGGSFEEFIQNRLDAQDRGEKLFVTVYVISSNTGQPGRMNIPLGTITDIQKDSQGKIIVVAETNQPQFEPILASKSSSTFSDLPLHFIVGSTGASTETDIGLFMDPQHPDKIQFVINMPPNKDYYSLRSDGSFASGLLTTIGTDFFMYLAQSQEVLNKIYSQGSRNIGDPDLGFDYMQDPNSILRNELYYPYLLGVDDPHNPPSNFRATVTIMVTNQPVSNPTS